MRALLLAGCCLFALPALADECPCQQASEATCEADCRATEVATAATKCDCEPCKCDDCDCGEVAATTTCEGCCPLQMAIAAALGKCACDPCKCDDCQCGKELATDVAAGTQTSPATRQFVVEVQLSQNGLRLFAPRLMVTAQRTATIAIGQSDSPLGYQLDVCVKPVNNTDITPIPADRATQQCEEDWLLLGRPHNVARGPVTIDDVLRR